MSMDKISVIIPVYNVEQYIRKCLDSVINQTYKNLEILLIDDGSTDSSGKICDEYAAFDSRIKVFHKINDGSSSARNTGLKYITGKYLGFVDSDDWIEPEMFEVLYKALIDNNVTLSSVSFTKDYETNSVPENGVESIPSRILTQKKMLLYALRCNYYGGFSRGLWNKLYRADIFKKHSLTFDKKLKVSHDIKILVEYLLADKCTGIFVSTPYYHYLQRGGSLINSNMPENEFRNELNGFKEIVVLIENHGYSDIAIWMKREHCYNASLLAERALKANNKKLFSEMQTEMKIYLKEYIDTNSEYPERIERMNGLINKAGAL